MRSSHEKFFLETFVNSLISLFTFNLSIDAFPDLVLLRCDYLKKSGGGGILNVFFGIFNVFLFQKQACGAFVCQQRVFILFWEPSENQFGLPKRPKKFFESSPPRKKS